MKEETLLLFTEPMKKHPDFLHLQECKIKTDVNTRHLSPWQKIVRYFEMTFTVTI